MISPVLAAVIICAANSAAAVIILKSASRRGDEKFSKIVLGSLVIRFFIMAGLIWAGLMIYGSEKTVFALSFLIACFVSILLEVLYINRFSKKLIKQKKDITKSQD